MTDTYREKQVREGLRIKAYDDPPQIREDLEALLRLLDAERCLSRDRELFCEIECNARMKAESERDAALAVLREVEWEVPVPYNTWDRDWLPGEGAYVQLQACPSCQGIFPNSNYSKHLRPELVGHKPDCRLAALLAGKGGE